MGLRGSGDEDMRVLEGNEGGGMIMFELNFTKQLIQLGMSIIWLRDHISGRVIYLKPCLRLWEE